jgi:hypothetical protein
VISVKAPVLMRISAPTMMNTIGTSQERVLHRQQWIYQHFNRGQDQSLDYGLELYNNGQRVKLAIFQVRSHTG